MLRTVTEIPLDDDKIRNSNVCPDQNVSESEKTPFWHFLNAQYFTTFYNRRSSYLSWPHAGVLDADPRGASSDQRSSPVQFMIKMMLYYLGQQPNMDYAFVTDDLTRSTMQAMWIRGQSVKEFVDFFKGNMMSRLTNAKWTAAPMSKRATSAKTDMYNKLMMGFDMKPFMKELEQKFNIEFSGSKVKEFEFPEEVRKWMDTDWKEFGAEICTAIAEDMWFKNNWLGKSLQAFMNMVITGYCEMHDEVIGGRNVQEVLAPYQVIRDLRRDSDTGEHDQFRGYIGSGTPNEIFTKFPQLSESQRNEINRIAKDTKLQGQYNLLTPNLTWWANSGGGRGTLSYVTMYWRTKHYTGKKSVKKQDGNKRIAKASIEEDQYIFDDIACCTIIANKYITNAGYIDNLVEEFGDISRPEFPIIRFSPNTFLGETVSEVARIHKIVDEIDYLDYKIRDMVGKAKGKVYIVNGSQFGEGDEAKSLMQALTTMGIEVRTPSGEPGEQDKKLVEMIDWTLDPNIDKLWNLIKEKEDRMKKTMSVSDISMGQPQTYFGFNTVQSTIAQNAVGTAYLFDGFMDWVVRCMRFSVNRAKLLYTTKGNLEASFVVGDRGIAFLHLFKELTWEQIFVKLMVNDVMDKEQKGRILTISQGAAQNSQLTLRDYLKIEGARSVSEAENVLDFAEKEKEIKAQKQGAQDFNNIMAEAEKKKIDAAELLQLREDNANFRAQLQSFTKNIDMLLKVAQSQPPGSPLIMELQKQAQEMADSGQPPQEGAPQE